MASLREAERPRLLLLRHQPAVPACPPLDAPAPLDDPHTDTHSLHRPRLPGLSQDWLVALAISLRWRDTIYLADGVRRGDIKYTDYDTHSLNIVLTFFAGGVR